MPNILYNRDIPDGPHSPSADQPKMKDNTNGTDTLIAVDHFSFNDNNGGFHKQVRLVDKLALPAFGDAVLAGQGGLYTKLASSTTPSTESSLFYTPDATGNEYQLTRTITASFPLFALNTQNYNGVGAAFFGGWTFLPGGLLLQYGFVFNVADGTTINFPVKFNLIPFSVLLTVNSTGLRFLAAIAPFSLTSFKIQSKTTSGGSGNVDFSWIAIGI